jgi:metal-sulfur cluster biosynthetic enzyme
MVTTRDDLDAARPDDQAVARPLAITRLLDAGTEADQLREMLHDVLDPELGVDIVSLGLVYGLELNARVAAVLITTTTPACPLGSYISAEIDRVLLGSGAVDRVEVAITHYPPWTPDRVSASVKRSFGWP